jgi:hypothetical protein
MRSKPRTQVRLPSQSPAAPLRAPAPGATLILACLCALAAIRCSQSPAAPPAPPARPATADVRGGDDDAAREAGAAAAPKLVPWLELNDENPRTVDSAVQGLLVWRRVTDTALVSTTPGHAGVYAKLRARVPNMRILPGLKTYTLLPRPDSVEGWREVAAEIRRLVAETGERTVLLENETALKECLDGKMTIDDERFRAALRTIPPDVTILWYPAIHSGNAAKNRRSETICRIVAESCRVQFTDLGRATPRTAAEKWTKASRETMRAISTRPAVPILYCCGDGYWSYSQIPPAAAECGAAEVLVFPGASRWRDAAEALAAAAAKDAAHEP